jgi:DNA-binding HxlR family transcriptional regulator
MPAPKSKGSATARAAAFDVYARNCPARMVFDRLTDKWSLLVIGRLRGGTLRFNHLRREIEGVSQKVLSHTLKRLERDGLVLRAVASTAPVTVEYSLTQLGATLAETIERVAHWAESHMPEIQAAQARYDAQTPAPQRER